MPSDPKLPAEELGAIPEVVIVETITEEQVALPTPH